MSGNTQYLLYLIKTSGAYQSDLDLCGSLKSLDIERHDTSELPYGHIFGKIFKPSFQFTDKHLLPRLLIRILRHFLSCKSG